MSDEPRKHHIPWLAILLGLAAIVALINLQSSSVGNIIPPVMETFGVGIRGQNQAIIPSSAPVLPSQTTYDSTQGSAPSAGVSNSLSADSALYKPGYPAPYPYPSGQTNVNDTREYNKIYYSAQMRTRDVPGLAKTIETLIRGTGGRVDETNSSHDSGYIRFVVPQTKFDDFRAEIEKLVDWRFLTVSVNSENLLPQKQALEKQQDFTNMSLDQLSAARKKEISDYTTRKNDLQYQIDANDRELAMLENELPTADANTKATIASRQVQLSSDQSSLKNQINSLERSHLNTINSIDAQISYQNGNKDALKQQTTDLLDNVATVDGTISLNWLSLWQFAQGYLPGYSIPGILALFAILALWWQRRREAVL